MRGMLLVLFLFTAVLGKWPKLEAAMRRLPINYTKVCSDKQRAVANRLVSLCDWVVGQKSRPSDGRICCLELEEVRCVRPGVGIAKSGIP